MRPSASFKIAQPEGFIEEWSKTYPASTALPLGVIELTTFLLYQGLSYLGTYQADDRRTIAIHDDVIPISLRYHVIAVDGRVLAWVRMPPAPQPSQPPERVRPCCVSSNW